ncbi:MAG TPA: site-specific integrase [Pyrinomonadaceae bacterium]|nr:site-specific integrase [Pyrinomonadaceae bacterium]
MGVTRRKDTGVYVVKGRMAGQSYYYYAKEASTKPQAKEIERQIRQMIFEGRWGSISGEMLFETFVRQHFIPHAEKHQRGWARCKLQVEWLIHQFKSKRLKDFTPLFLEGWKRQRANTDTHLKRKPAPATINLDLATLSRIFTMAVDFELVRTNPLRKVKPLAVDNRRERVLTHDEEDRLMKALESRNPEVRRAVIIALNTGMRRGEIMNLRWSYIDGRKGIIFLPKSITKAGKEREVPICSKVRAVLNEIKSFPLGEGEYLFHHRKGIILSDKKGAFHSALRAAKIDDFHFHDLRHTFASRLPADPYLRRDLLGHATVDMSARYSHTSMEERRQAVENLNGAQVVEITRKAEKIG